MTFQHGQDGTALTGVSWAILDRNRSIRIAQRMPPATQSGSADALLSKTVKRSDSGSNEPMRPFICCSARPVAYCPGVGADIENDILPDAI